MAVPSVLSKHGMSNARANGHSPQKSSAMANVSELPDSAGAFDRPDARTVRRSQRTLAADARSGRTRRTHAADARGGRTRRTHAAAGYHRKRGTGSPPPPWGAVSNARRIGARGRVEPVGVTLQLVGAPARGRAFWALADRSRGGDSTDPRLL